LKFGDFVDHIYPIEYETRDISGAARSYSYLDLYLYDTRDDLNFPIVIFPFMCNNIPAAPAYEIYNIYFS
jgi:hypothetical protein